MPTTNSKFTIKPENAIYYGVEINNRIGSDPTVFEDEYQEKVRVANETFDREVVEPELLKHIAPCECRQAELMNRAMRRYALLAGTAQSGQPPVVELTQEDVDQLEFGIIVKTENMFNLKPLLYIRRCKLCGRMEFYGNIRVLMKGFAEMADKFFVAEGVNADLADDEPEDDDSDTPEFIMENTETGEQIGSNSMEELLSGGGEVLSKRVKLSDDQASDDSPTGDLILND